MNNININVRYTLPKNNSEAKQKLAEVLKIPLNKLIGDEATIIAAMSGTILYRHLTRLEKMAAMEKIKSLSYPQLQDILVTKCLDPFVNPQWAEWSLTNEELKEVLKFHNQFNRWSSLLGANPGAYGVGGSVWSIIDKGVSKGNLAVLVASLILIGLHEFSYNETMKYSEELQRRTILN